MKYSILLIAFISSFTWAASQNNIYTIQETEDSIITGARKMIYQDSLLLIGDVNSKEIFLVHREGEILNKYQALDSFGDSLIKTASQYNKNAVFYPIDTYREYAPETFESGKISQLLGNLVSDLNIVDGKVAFSGLFSTLAKDSVEANDFFIYPLPGFACYSVNKSVSDASVRFIKPLPNSMTTGLNNCFVHGKYSNTYLSNCLDERLDSPNNDPQGLDYDSIYRFVEYNKDLDAVSLQLPTPKELRYKVFVQFLKSFATQTSDSSFWATFNYYPVLFNLKNNSKFKLSLPNIANDSMLSRLRYCEKHARDSIRLSIREYAKYLNYEVLYLNATNNDELIVDILHATENKETGKKEQYHILQKYSTSGELLAEKVFPQDGKLGNLQRIAYSPERGEFAFLIFKDQNWLLAYSKENQVW